MILPMGSIRTFLHHAFGFRTIGPIFVSGFGGWTALADRRMTIDDPNFWFLAVTGVGCGLISWAVIAYDNWQKDLQVKQSNAEFVRTRTALDSVSEELRKLRPAPSPAKLANIRHWSNSELKGRVAKIASEMVNLELGQRKVQRAIHDRFRSKSASGGDSKSAWETMQSEHDATSDQLNATFRKQLMPEALALRDEMRLRLGILPPPRPNLDEMALDLGMLAGVSPLLDAANALRRLASNLDD